MSIETTNLHLVSYAAALEEQGRPLAREKIRIIIFESEPVVTLGLRSHGMAIDPSLNPLKVDRGGEATYHGPGQLVFFPSIHLPTWDFTVKKWIEVLLRVSQKTLADFHIPSEWNLKCPGLHTEKGKIASVGIKIQNGGNRHGLALNVNGDLAPFSKIIACGVQSAKVDQLSSWLPEIRKEDVAAKWVRNLEEMVGPFNASAGNVLHPK